MEYDNKTLRRSCNLYTAEAALEHLIATLMTGSFLATLTKHLGFSDGLTGILSAIVSLGCLFQLLSIGIRKRRVKRFVVTFSIINQALFLSLYLIPILNLGKTVKAVLFTVVIILAYLIYNIAHPKKISWLMSLVEENRRGIFTANKEIISLISGIVFSFFMGSCTDYFLEQGKDNVAFIITALVILVISLAHTLTMVFTVEKEYEKPARSADGLRASIKEIFSNRDILTICLLFALYYISNFASHPFYGTYAINELGFNLKFVATLGLAGNVSRILVSKFWGRYADKNSFAKMIEKCFMVLFVSQMLVVFATPQNGKVLFILYYVVHGVAMGGINSAFVNLIFDYVPVEKRADSLSVTQAAAGTVGFITTLCASPVVSAMQQNGNRIFGFTVYAQQLLSAVSAAITLLLIVFVRKVIINKKSS